MKNTIVVILLCISGLTLTAQNLDSLYSIWQDPDRPDSSRVSAYNNYIWKGYLFSRPDTAEVLAQVLHTYAKANQYRNASALGYNLQGIANYLQGKYSIALEYYKKSLAIQEETGDKQGTANSLNNIGGIYTNQGDYLNAIEYYQKSLALNEKLDNKTGIANSLNNIGLIYDYQGNYPRALDYYHRSLAIFEDIGDKVGKAANLINIGTIYKEQGNYTRALEYLQNSLTINEELDDKQGIASSLNNLGTIYKDQGNISSALDFYQKGLALSEEIGDKQGIASRLNNIGSIYSDQRNYTRALEYYQKSLLIREEIGDKRGIANCMNNIGRIFIHQGKYSVAVKYCEKGLKAAEEMGALELQKNTCQCLYDAYKAMDKGNLALKYLEKLRMVEDGLKAEETAKKIQQIEFQKAMMQDSMERVEEARKQKEAHESEIRRKNQIRNWTLAGGVLALLLAGGFYSRWRFVQKSKKIIEKEKERSENLLLNILPDEIARELKEKGRAEARNFDQVSILFTDFVSFTETSEKLTAAELVNEISHCFEAFDLIIEKYSIEKIKTIGDAYMAAGGLPVPFNSSVKNTVLAALEMQEFIQKRKANKDALGQISFDMRLGIHSGPVVAGIVGLKKFQYDIWGDTVNTASRIESHGAAGKVNISQVTYDLIKDDPDFIFTSREKVEVKGKGEMKMYFVSRA